MTKQLDLFGSSHMEGRPSMSPDPLAVPREYGGPPSAREVERIIRGRSIEFAGYAFEKGPPWRVVCPKHRDRWIDGAGFKIPIYYDGARPNEDLGDCEVCGEQVVGEDPWPTKA